MTFLLQFLPAILIAALVGLAGLAWFRRRLRTTEEALRTSVDAERARSRELEAVLDTAVDAIIVINDRGLIETFNAGAERLFGYPASEAIGQNVNLLMPSPDRERHDGYLARYLSTGDARIVGIGREVQGRRRDGTVFPLHLSVGEMNVNGKRRFTGILHDLSVRTAMERQLREHTSLARLGEMAAVVAHEVKNPLAGIRGAIQIIGGRLPADSRDRLMVDEIVSRIDSLAGLMKDLLTFARPPKPQPKPTDIVRLVQLTADLLKQDPAARDVVVQIDGAAQPVMADASLLQIVFHNVLANSAQAMKGAGRIRVSVAEADGLCQVAIVDEGPGIPADVGEHIFTPFFTTKSRGSGLGLTTSRRLVEAHQGAISVECPPEGGTRVVISLPTGDRTE